MSRSHTRDASSPLRIGTLAKATGLTPDTMRYYERLGLLPRAGRTAGGFRAYGPGTIERIRFIKAAQAHGLSLREIRDLLRDQGAGREGCRRVRDVLSKRLAELERKRDELNAFCAALRQHLTRCDRALVSAADCRCPAVDDLVKAAARMEAWS